MNNTYVLVEWSEVQDLMEEEWFRSEAVLNLEGSGSYFIPEHRILNNDYIVTRSIELAQQFESTIKHEQYIEDEWCEVFPFEGGMSAEESILNLKIISRNE